MQREIENTVSEARAMAERHGSKFASCPCGRVRVLMYRRGAGNGPDSDRLTYHDTPEGVSCEHGGALLRDVKGAAEVTL